MGIHNSSARRSMMKKNTKAFILGAIGVYLVLEHLDLILAFAKAVSTDKKSIVPEKDINPKKKMIE